MFFLRIDYMHYCQFYLLSGIFFYNFTTPEFNVNISQLPFWALCVYYFLKVLIQIIKLIGYLFGIFWTRIFIKVFFHLFIISIIFIFFYILKNI